MSDFEVIWERVGARAGEVFTTKTGLDFTYSVPGAYVRITRAGHEIDRSLSKMNFAKGVVLLPSDGPGALSGRQGASYTWAILMDERIRQGSF